MGCMDTCPESGADGCQLKEPTSTLWKGLKIVFLIINVLISLGLFGLLYAIIFLIGWGKSEDENGNPIYPEIAENYTALVTLSILQFVNSSVQVVIGFIGIFKLNLRALFIYSCLILVSSVIQFAATIIFESSHVILLSNSYLVMMYFLIRELRIENGLA